jgi:hypothetical protein
VTARTPDGREVFRDSKIYMPQATNSRGDAMLYGAQFKMGLVADTTLQPGQTRVEKYEITFPYEDIEKEPGKKTREIKAREMEVTVELRYQPGGSPGEPGKGHFVIYREARKITID